MYTSKNHIPEIEVSPVKKLFEQHLIETDLKTISHNLLYDFNRLVEEAIFQKLNSLSISFKIKSFTFDYYINSVYKPSKTNNLISSIIIMDNYNKWIDINDMFSNRKIDSTVELKNLMSYLGYNKYSDNKQNYKFDLR